jgi:hypothetical protein
MNTSSYACSSKVTRMVIKVRQTQREDTRSWHYKNSNGTINSEKSKKLYKKGNLIIVNYMA